jgi:hypothetical protein
MFRNMVMDVFLQLFYRNFGVFHIKVCFRDPFAGKVNRRRTL